MENRMIDLSGVIGIYGLTNTWAVLVHEIDYGNERVLASMNGTDPGWCEMTELDMEGDGNTEPGFLLGSLPVPFSGVMRFYGGADAKDS